MKFKDKWQYHFLWISIFFTSITGTLLLIMKYILSPMDMFSVINHPWQSITLKLHILFAPFMIFGLGYTTVLHVIPYIKENMRKSLKTGLSAFIMLCPMILSGYFIQCLTNQNWNKIASILHIATSFVFLISFIIHQLISHREKLIIHTCIIFIFLFFSSFPLWPIKKTLSTNKQQDQFSSNQIERSWVLMGTLLLVQIETKNKELAKEKAEIIWKVVNDLDQKMSTHKTNSDISRINRLAAFKEISVDKDIFEAIQLSKLISEQSLLAFDITTSPLIKLWKKAQKENHLPLKTSNQMARGYVGSFNIQINHKKNSIYFLKKGMSINMGAIGKGFALEKAINQINDDTLFCATLNFGGQIVYIKNRPHCKSKSFAVQRVNHNHRPIIFKLDSTRSLATSSNSEHYFIYKGMSYGHILDPRTGFPANKVLSVTVAHPSPTLADAWATALFVLGPSHEKRILKLHPKMKVRWVLND